MPVSERLFNLVTCQSTQTHVPASFLKTWRFRNSPLTAWVAESFVRTRLRTTPSSPDLQSPNSSSSRNAFRFGGLPILLSNADRSSSSPSPSTHADSQLELNAPA